MSLKLKSRWEALRRGKPGQRFQDRYRASRGSDRSGVILRILRMVLAALAIVIGVVLMFIPGPAILFFAIAGALLASESRVVARFLDWSEVMIRRVVRWALRVWKRLSWPGRGAVIALAAVGAAGASYAAYRIVFGG